LAERAVIHALHLAHNQAIGVELVSDGAARGSDTEHGAWLHAAQLTLHAARDALLGREAGHLAKRRLNGGLNELAERLRERRAHAQTTRRSSYDCLA